MVIIDLTNILLLCINTKKLTTWSIFISRNGEEIMQKQKMPFELLIVLVFMFLAAAMCLLVSYTIYVPKTPLDIIWKIKPGTEAKIHYFGHMVAPILLTLCVAMFVTAMSMIYRQRWAAYTAIAIFAINGIADGIRIFKDEILNGFMGIIATLIFIWLIYISLKSGFFNPTNPKMFKINNK